MRLRVFAPSWFSFRSARVQLRRVVQAASLLLFLYLVVSARHPLESILPTDLYLRLDPLAQISASVAAREVAGHLLWALPLLLATALLGRFFCGWLCPLGVTLDVARLRRFNPPRPRRERGMRALKYLILAALLASALAGSALLMALDPISLLTRTFAVYIYPAFSAAVTGALFLFYERGVLPDLMVWVDTDLRGSLLPFEQPYFRLAWLFLALFAAVLVLNLVSHRFWCRYLCPLGSLLGLTSRWSLLRRRVGEGCSGCGKCLATCRMGAVHPRGFGSSSGECALCGECAAVCPDGAISYGGRPLPAGGYDPSRRGFLAVGGLAALGVGGLNVDSPSQEVDPFLVRPPGARAEGEFLSSCIRCGQCMKACPTSGLQPSLFQAGLGGLWSPVLVSRIGPCVYDCTTCGHVCPTSAIRPLSLEVKQETIIGTAYIDQRRCIPWVDGRTCIVCEELCPVSPKAVVLDPVEVRTGDGDVTTVDGPRVVRPRCIGCGICERMCPLPGESAIRVYNTSALLSEEGEVLPP